MTPFFQTASFSQAMTQTVSHAAYGGANLRECLTAAKQIRDGDCESWHLAWVTLAEQVRLQARHALTRGTQNEVRDAFLRAAVYYQTAGRFLARNLGDARIATTAEASSACFATALRLSGHTYSIEEIEVGGKRRLAPFYCASGGNQPRPTLLVVGDTTSALSLYFWCAVAAMRHGWHCLTVPHEAADAPAALSALASAARFLPSVDAACLAQMIFRGEDILSAGEYRGWAYPLGQGTAEALRAAGQARRLPGDAAIIEDSSASWSSLSLSDFHQRLSHWLG